MADRRAKESAKNHDPQEKQKSSGQKKQLQDEASGSVSGSQGQVSAQKGKQQP